MRWAVGTVPQGDQLQSSRLGVQGAWAVAAFGQFVSRGPLPTVMQHQGCCLSFFDMGIMMTMMVKMMMVVTMT
eukprot:12336351-Karenia_brevis.AAC.1